MQETFQWTDEAIELGEGKIAEGYIYKLTLLVEVSDFKAGEVYIGKHSGAKPEYFTGGTLPKRIIAKHGKEVFSREILAKEISNEALLDYLEIYYIEYFKCNRAKYKTGLNLTDGGEGTTGIIRSKENAVKISESIKKRYATGKVAPPRSKKVYQFDLATKKCVGEYRDCVVAARAVGVIPSSIAYCARGNNYSVKDFGWSYEKLDSYRDKENIPVYQYTPNGKLVKKYSSLEEACRQTGFGKSGIVSCCKSRSETSFGYVWRRTDFGPVVPDGNFGRERKKPVDQFDLAGNFIKEFESVAEAARQTGIYESSIAKVCKGTQKVAHGFVFQFTLVKQKLNQ